MASKIKKKNVPFVLNTQNVYRFDTLMAQKKRKQEEAKKLTY